MKIKYDGRTNKILRIATVFAGLFTLAGWVCMLNEVSGTEVLMVAGIYGGNLLFFYSGVQSLAGWCYVRRLKRHEYEVPYRKEEYGNKLENVPRNGKTTQISGKSTESRVLFLTYMLIWVSVNVWNVSFFIRWYQYIKSLVMSLMWVQIGMDICWLIGAIIFFRQMNPAKYRDDVEQDPARKVRIPLEKGMILGIFGLLILLFTKNMIVHGADYVFHARGEHDYYYLQDIQGAVHMAMENECEGKSYGQLVEGCYISDWTIPEDEFARAIADTLGIEDFSELEEKIYCSEGKPAIYVKITDGEVCVRMENPLRQNHGTQYTYEVK